METTVINRGYIRGYIGVIQKKMEATMQKRSSITMLSLKPAQVKPGALKVPLPRKDWPGFGPQTPEAFASSLAWQDQRQIVLDWLLGELSLVYIPEISTTLSISCMMTNFFLLRRTVLSSRLHAGRQQR